MTLRSLCMALVVASAIGVGTAKADGLAVGVPFPAVWWVCDTEEQVLELDRAFTEGGNEKMKEVYTGFQNQKNDIGDPVCGRLQGIFVILEGRPALTPLFEGRKRWVVKVKFGTTEFWSLYAGELNGSTVPPQSGTDNPTPPVTYTGSGWSI